MITSTDKNLLIHNLIHDYAEKLFYFCLKKPVTIMRQKI